jgi:hypothetical protein
VHVHALVICCGSFLHCYTIIGCAAILFWAFGGEKSSFEGSATIVATAKNTRNSAKHHLDCTSSRQLKWRFSLLSVEGKMVPKTLAPFHHDFSAWYVGEMCVAQSIQPVWNKGRDRGGTQMLPRINDSLNNRCVQRKVRHRQSKNVSNLCDKLCSLRSSTANSPWHNCAVCSECMQKFKMAEKGLIKSFVP